MGLSNHILVPPGVVPCFDNPSERPLKFSVSFEPGNEDLGTSVKKACSRATPSNFAYMALMLTPNDTCPTGIFSLLLLLLGWKVPQGLKQELIDC